MSNALMTAGSWVSFSSLKSSRPLCTSWPPVAIEKIQNSCRKYVLFRGHTSGLPDLFTEILAGDGDVETGIRLDPDAFIRPLIAGRAPVNGLCFSFCLAFFAGIELADVGEPAVVFDNPFQNLCRIIVVVPADRV